MPPMTGFMLITLALAEVRNSEGKLLVAVASEFTYVALRHQFFIPITSSPNEFVTFPQFS